MKKYIFFIVLFSDLSFSTEFDAYTLESICPDLVGSSVSGFESPARADAISRMDFCNSLGPRTCFIEDVGAQYSLVNVKYVNQVCSPSVPDPDLSPVLSSYNSVSITDVLLVGPSGYQYSYDNHFSSHTFFEYQLPTGEKISGPSTRSLYGYQGSSNTEITVSDYPGVVNLGPLVFNDCDQFGLNSVSRVYCNQAGNLAYGTGWDGCPTDGNEQFFPAELCEAEETVPNDPVSIGSPSLENSLGASDRTFLTLENNRLSSGFSSSISDLETSNSHNTQILSGAIEGINNRLGATGELTSGLTQIRDNTSSLSNLVNGNQITQIDLDELRLACNDALNRDLPLCKEASDYSNSLSDINNKLSVLLDKDGSGAFSDDSYKIQLAKDDFANQLSIVMDDIESTLALSVAGSSSLSCSSSFQVLGSDFDFCISEYSDQLSLISDGLVAFSMIVAGFIMLGGLRV